MFNRKRQVQAAREERIIKRSRTNIVGTPWSSKPPAVFIPGENHLQDRRFSPAVRLTALPPYTLALIFSFCHSRSFLLTSTAIRDSVTMFRRSLWVKHMNPQVARASHLQQLTVSATTRDAKSFREMVIMLRKLKYLRHLSLVGAIKDLSSILRACPRLETLDLADSRITTDDIQRAPHLWSLRTVLFGASFPMAPDCDIAEVFAALRRLVSMLDQNVTLGDGLFRQIGFDFPRRTERISIVCCSRLTNLAGIGAFKGLRSLELRGCATIEDETLAAGLMEVPHVSEVLLSATRVGRITITQLLTRPTLEVLDISLPVAAEPRGFLLHLCSSRRAELSPALRWLSLAYSPVDSADVWSVLLSFPTLYSLDISFTAVDDNLLHFPWQTLSHLRRQEDSMPIGGALHKLYVRFVHLQNPSYITQIAANASLVWEHVAVRSFKAACAAFWL
ncbi:MAG: uncharacterized protein KVP18_003130 [Porospora cf. gigantea A]|uniref:uncharacterized protein n=1 Tax=Porospora cf. gigantea A TaxID=2853593 RepID=UPI0035598D90|nr:MAG: hypothetical protein KVP18_003130 [Porospora cf. gigantea A]